MTTNASADECDHVWLPAGVFTYTRPHGFYMEFGVEESDPRFAEDPNYEPRKEGAASFALIGLPRLECAHCGEEKPGGTALDERELWRLSREAQRAALVLTSSGWKASK